jgi:hypothetical protein
VDSGKRHGPDWGPRWRQDVDLVERCSGKGVSRFCLVETVSKIEKYAK